MFDELAQRGPTAGDGALALVAAAIRTGWSRVMLGCGSLGLGATSLTGSWAAHAIGPGPCVDLPQAEFTLEELIATKDKVLAYAGNPRGELVLSGKQASFVLADHLKYPVWIETRGDELLVRAAIPEGDRCYDVRFKGHVEVRDGHAHIVPSALTVGGLNASALVAGRGFAVEPAHLDNREARDLLAQTRHLTVSADQLHVALADPGSLL